MKNDDHIMHELYTSWCVALFNADCLYDELDEDFTHPLFLEADQKARKALSIFLNHQTESPRYIFLKLQIACDVEDYLTDAMNPACSDIAPRAVVAAMYDIRHLAEYN